MARRPKRSPDRRSVLKGGAAGLLSASLPGCRTSSAPAGDTAPAGPGQIDHVVVVMMENRSFDHYLGALSLHEGVAVDGLTEGMSNPGRDGAPVPIHHLDIMCQEDPPHGWSSSHDQFNGGACDGFVTEHADGVGDSIGAEAIGYYTRDDLPIHYGLADHFAVPDRWFCSVMSSTWPNRLYGQAGTSGGETGNDLPETESRAFEFKTVYKALEEAGLEWRYYYTDIPFIGLFNDHWDESRIHLIDDFLDDAEAGDLPPFTWVDPGFSVNDDHPPHHVGLGQVFLALVYEALARSPAWERTLLVITYDEHGGFFDHVAPPTVEDEHADEGFDQLGFRVPSLVIGPWVKPGVDSTVFDHTSVLRYVCDRFGLDPWTTRIATANSIEALLDADRMAAGEPLEAPVLDPFEVPDSEVGSECLYARRAGGFASGQPELERFIMEHLPESSRLHQRAAIRDALLARARAWGLVR